MGKAQNVGNLGPHSNVTIALTAPWPSITKENAQEGLGKWGTQYGHLYSFKEDLYQLMDDEVWSKRRS